jgi:phospholipid transport system substrate-binding protein
MNIFTRLQSALLSSLLSWAIVFSPANAFGQSSYQNVLYKTDPYKIVEQTTAQVLEIVNEAKKNSEKNTELFQKNVMAVLDKVIDFDDFARGVMGTYASERRYQMLKTDAEKTLFRERIQWFSSSFKQGLVKTYANSLLNFSGEKIETLPPRKGDDPATGSVTILQNFYSTSGKTYVIQYSMRRNKSGEWKLKNLIVEGINIGLIYRNQFAAAAEQYRDDIGKVIEHWNVELQTQNSTSSAAAINADAKNNGAP